MEGSRAEGLSSAPPLDVAVAEAVAGRREAEWRMRLALDAAAIGVWEFDPGTGRLSWDDRVRAVAEVDAETTPTFAGHFIACVHALDRERVAAAFADLLDPDSPSDLSIECRIVGLKTGAVTWSVLEGRRLATPDGSPRVVGTARDVSVQHALTEQLRALNEGLERRVAEGVAERQIWADMFESCEDPIAAIDPSFRLMAANTAYRTAFARFYGRPIAVGDSLEERLAHRPEWREAALGVWRQALSGEVVDVPRSREQGVDRGGPVYEIKFRPLRSRDGTLLGAFQYSREVTDQVRAASKLAETKEALLRSQKMEALGQLTGGVAHDFNNLLQVIGGNLQLLRSCLAGDPRSERRVENALAAVTRGSRLASQLLAFGRRQPLEPKVVNLGRFIQGLDDMLRRALGEEIVLNTEVVEGLWNSSVDPNQIENAILNLALNARDAMDGRGRLTIEAGNAVLDEAYALNHEEVAAGDYVMIEVADTGCGMTPEVLERVFEPFFTTKPEGRGTGLGLSMVYGLVKQSSGHINITSAPGEGTSIKLYLPRSEEKEDVSAPAEAAPVLGGAETILVAEDDLDVQETAAALLSALGYRVLKAQDGASALAIIRSGVEVDLLFTDVVMPGPLRSPELARLTRRYSPRTAILFTSGYIQDAINHGGRVDAGVELLSKPYTHEALARKVRQVLAGRLLERPDGEARFESPELAGLPGEILDGASASQSVEGPAGRL